jgi:gluconolactonase
MLNTVTDIKIYPQSYYTEGPVIDATGKVYFTNLAGGMIIRMNGEHFSDWAQSNCPNGQIILPNGDHIICDSRQSALIRFDEEGVFLGKDVDGRCAGEQVKVPNDLIADKMGNIYFTDSVRHEGKVFFLGANGEQKVLASGLDYPNGLALSRDEKRIFVAESYQNRVIAFEINGSLPLANDCVWVNLPRNPSMKITDNLPDGIKVDDYGCLWVAHYGMSKIHQFSPSGKLMQSILLPFEFVSNLFIRENTVVVTGGYNEPGPGAIAKIELTNE